MYDFDGSTASKVPPIFSIITRMCSVGNVTGSNSVNVFLGLGLPWMAAAFYWKYVGSSGATEAAWRARYSGASWYTPGMPVGFVVEAADLGF